MSRLDMAGRVVNRYRTGITLVVFGLVVATALGTAMLFPTRARADANCGNGCSTVTTRQVGPPLPTASATAAPSNYPPICTRCPNIP